MNKFKVHNKNRLSKTHNKNNINLMKKSEKNLLKTINQNIAVHKKLFKISKKIGQVIDLFSTGLNNDKTIYICGNGGSASDSEHLSTEFLVRLNSKVNRRPFKMVNLGMNLSYITACSNDYSFENVFSRSLEALANPGDILWVISTSGDSKNIKKALISAKKLKLRTVGFYGKSGGVSKKFTEYPILVDSNVTARIQECHIFLGHYILEEIENFLIKNN